MPPFNPARRDRLADAAIALLAREGSRGLTHRAVDAEAGEPPGTTSRYFRTRDALLRGVVDRLRALHLADLGHLAGGPIGEDAIAGHLASLLHQALTEHRSRHLALAELFAQSARRPDLHAALAETRTAQIELMRQIHRAAGIELSQRRAALLVAAMTGLLIIALTTPEALGLREVGDLDALVRDMVHAAWGAGGD